jgi:hypothetical protein
MNTVILFGIRKKIAISIEESNNIVVTIKWLW